jgi:hypothetical protein
MSSYTVVIADSERRRRRPLAHHTGLTAREAFELAAVHRALGHRAEDITVGSDANERAS